jgi:hypothetical protein
MNGLAAAGGHVELSAIGYQLSAIRYRGPMAADR